MRLLIAWCLLGSIGCSAVPREREDAEYVLVYLKSGPTSGTGDKAQRSTMFAGHMANIQRLADERSLLIAGPFTKPEDKALRGILLMDVPTISQAQELAATDPGVQAGEFVADAHALRAAPSLRQTYELEQAMLAQATAQPTSQTPAPGSPPPNIRAYVMVTAEDFDRTRRAVGESVWKERIVWSGQFTGTGRGVLVLDAPVASEVRAGLTNPGACSIDGWWSTTSLTRLPKQ